MGAATHYHADAWGGVQADEYAGGSTSPRALHPSSAQWTEAVWDDTEILDQQFCMSISSKTDMQCRAYKVKNEEHCVFHLRQMRNAQVAEEQSEQAATDGSEPSEH